MDMKLKNDGLFKGDKMKILIVSCLLLAACCSKPEEVKPTPSPTPVPSPAPSVKKVSMYINPNGY